MRDMNRRQVIILGVGCFLIIIHLVLFFVNVYAKYEKLQFERRKLEISYSQSVSAAVENKEVTLNRVFLAWMAVSVFLVSGTGFSLWICRPRPPK